ncbi:MAG TPA: hypothetical protein VEQ85_01330, partial [Lacipirellulaceae bacterium]|nr:hypothetical protein [Lacipirellulaceae bacterium]
ANVAWDLGISSLGPVLNTFSVIPLGSLTGGPNSSISGHSSGGGSGATVYEIGGLNTSTTFQGNIIDGRTDLNPISTTSIVKVGTGTLTLTDPVDVNDVNGLAPEPVYTGFTKILGGTLSIQTPYLADGSDVYIASGAVFDLNTGVGTIDVIDSLILNNVPMAPGTYGAPGSGASFTSTFFSGTGQLQVTTLGVAPVAGDFDGNGTVQAADLAVLQQSFGYSRGGDLDQDGDTDGNDFVLWQRLGVSPTLAAGGAVPEPAAGLLAALVLPALAAARRRRLA